MYIFRLPYDGVLGTSSYEILSFRDEHVYVLHVK
jgi:hypothetical protein